jgi:hypothetical protein
LGLPGEFFQAGGTNNAVVVLGDAFTAEELFTLGAASDGLASGMIETTLISETIHF